MFKDIRRALLAGLAVVLPLAATVWLVIFLIGLLHSLGQSLLILVVRTGLWEWNKAAWPDGRISSEYLQWPGAGVLSVLLPLVIVGLIGYTARHGMGRKGIDWLEQQVYQLPGLGKVYKIVRQFSDSVQKLGKTEFKRVVYVPYPAEGYNLIGFVVGEYFDKARNLHMTSIFMPTSPNPLTGFILLIDSRKVLPGDMDMEAALKMLFSAGVVTPEPSQTTPGEGDHPVRVKSWWRRWIAGGRDDL